MREALYRVMTDQGTGAAALLLRWLAACLSRIYGRFMPVVRAACLRKRVRAPLKVISVGNLTVGGTGKTSLVIYIARQLQKSERKVAVVTRGYRKRVSGDQGIGGSGGVWADEAAMLSAALGEIPVIIDPLRLRGAREAYYTYGSDTAVLDDGFQQWKLVKDLEIVCIDARNPFGNGKLIPRGILREEPAALRRADILVLSKVNLQPDIVGLECLAERLNPEALIVHAEHRPTGLRLLGAAGGGEELAWASDKKALVFSGIGDHASFEELARQLGLTVVGSMRFDDHHWYTQRDLEHIRAAARQSAADILLTTQKDAQRIEKGALSLGESDWYALMIELVITKDEERFLDRLHHLSAV